MILLKRRNGQSVQAPAQNPILCLSNERLNMGDYLKFEAYKKKPKIMTTRSYCCYLHEYANELAQRINTMLDMVVEQNKIIGEHERIIKNQPLIKKYQKTLDIFLKNTKNE